MSEEEKKGFKIVDRRRFDMEGEEREGADQEDKPRPDIAAAETPAARPAPAQPAPAQPAPAAEADDGGDEPDPADREATALFLGFLNSLAQQCAMHLGLMPYPSGHRELNLEAARDTIDILAVLGQKTKGNLSAEEDKFLKGLMHELRMTFLEVGRKVQAAAGPPGPGPGPKM